MTARTKGERMIYHASFAGTQLPVRLVAAMPDDEQFQSLNTGLSGTGWTICRTHSIAEGLRAIVSQEANVVVTCCDLADGSWPEMIQALQPSPNAPRVVVASPIADDRLWMDVLGSGGYDVLSTPFERLELVHVLQMAWLSWKKTADQAHALSFPEAAFQPQQISRENGQRLTGGSTRR
jgi:DNA-binding response OmpR family regulator